jgi:hypothetical protein
MKRINLPMRLDQPTTWINESSTGPGKRKLFGGENFVEELEGGKLLQIPSRPMELGCPT